MAQTTILAATTSAANSSDVVVATGAVKLSMFMTGGNVQNAKDASDKYERVLCVIQEKDPNGVYVNTYADGKLLTISRKNPQQVLIGPGTYRVTKPATVNAIGLYSEDGT
jgi:hypothetical protein